MRVHIRGRILRQIAQQPQPCSQLRASHICIACPHSLLHFRDLRPIPLHRELLVLLEDGLRPPIAGIRRLHCRQRDRHIRSIDYFCCYKMRQIVLILFNIDAELEVLRVYTSNMQI